MGVLGRGLFIDVIANDKDGLKDRLSAIGNNPIKIGNSGKCLIYRLLILTATRLSSSVIRQASRATRTVQFFDGGTW